MHGRKNIKVILV